MAITRAKLPTPARMFGCFVYCTAPARRPLNAGQRWTDRHTPPNETTGLHPVGVVRGFLFPKMYNAPRDTSKLAPLVIGGCIELQRPSDKSIGCQCYQVSFIVCHNLRGIRVTMCREWARYMAGHRAISTRMTPDDAWGGVVRDAITKALPIGRSRGGWQWNVRSKTLRELIEPLGYFPSYFEETVMDNRYGNITNAIPLKDIAENYFSDDFETMSKARRYSVEWMGDGDRIGRNVFDRNYDEYTKFKKVLENIANHAKAIDSMKQHVKQSGTLAADFAAVLLHVASTEARVSKQVDQQPKQLEK